MLFNIDKAKASFLTTFGTPAPAGNGLEYLLGRMATGVSWMSVAQMAYGLATFYWETGRTLTPCCEEGALSYFTKYDLPPLRARLGNTISGDGFRFRGRGFVQLTGAANYLHAGRKLGLDLTHDPDQALHLDTAYDIAVRGMYEGWFTGHAMEDFIPDGGPIDLVGARKIINGTDHAQEIADIAHKFVTVLVACYEAV